MPKAHQSVATVADPIFTVRHRKGVGRFGLFEVFAAISSDDLVDFPAMAAHQRAAVVTVLSILMHLLRRYEGYSVMRDALAETRKVAIGQLIMHGRQHMVGIKAVLLALSVTRVPVIVMRVMAKCAPLRRL
jgi:hypothetical protein